MDIGYGGNKVKAMAKIETYKCDVCGVLKGETNHWFKISMGTAYAIVAKFDVAETGESLSHVCGQSCAQHKLNEFMGRAYAC